MVPCVRLTFIVLVILLAFTDSKSLKKRIVGGENAFHGEFPYIVSIRTYQFMLSFCAGTIITNRHVVSAAHCTADFQPETKNMFIVVGAWHLVDDGRRMDIERVAIHPFYSFVSLQHDISVLKTSLPIEFSAFVQPISLPTMNLPDTGGIECVISGWGKTVN